MQEEVESSIVSSNSISAGILTGANSPRARILHIEDDADTRELVKFILVHAGHEVVGVETCNEFLALAKAHRFDLYLIDHTLPDGSGFTLCQQLRTFHADSRIVVCSGWVTPNHTMSASQCGVEGYLTKPFTPEELLDEVKRVLKIDRSSAGVDRGRNEM